MKSRDDSIQFESSYDSSTHITITVITPSLNRDSFIENCIKNVIDQNCMNCEHLIIDGGSTDRTLEILDEYSKRFSHLRYISEPDTGVSQALNKGIRLARGQIIGILNTDDFYQPRTLNRVLEIFQKLSDPSLVVGDCLHWWNDQASIGALGKLTFESLMLGYELNPHPANPSAYFYHRSLHDVAGFYDEQNKYNMDFDFLLRAVRKAHVLRVKEIWCLASSLFAASDSLNFPLGNTVISPR
jgi:glycosyltransferase involved in cell wall biosynthesis